MNKWISGYNFVLWGQLLYRILENLHFLGEKKTEWKCCFVVKQSGLPWDALRQFQVVERTGELNSQSSELQAAWLNRASLSAASPKSIATTCLQACPVRWEKARVYCHRMLFSRRVSRSLRSRRCPHGTCLRVRRTRLLCPGPGSALSVWTGRW